MSNIYNIGKGECIMILEVKNCVIGYGKTPTIQGVSFTIARGEMVGLVGESGCGKSTLSKAIAGFLSIQSGEVKRYTKNIQMIFQDTLSALNPAKTIGFLLEEPLKVQKIPKDIRKQRVEEMIVKIGLTIEHLKRYPKELSGGQRQRICIAIALLQGAELIIADEPMSALDVTVQKQMIELIQQLQKEHKVAYLFISHDLNIVSELCDRVLIMKEGQVVEQGTVLDVFSNPKDEHTKRLLEASFSHCSFYDC